MKSADSDTFLGAEEISYSIPGLDILVDVDFRILPGEIHALVGKQNEGKSTFAKILAGELRPSSGAIVASGRRFSALTSKQARDIGIEYVGNTPMVYPELTVADNLVSGTSTWRRTLALWRSGLEEVNAWLQANGIQLPYEQTLDKMRKDDWLFIELLNRLYRKPKLLILDESPERLRPSRYREVMRIIRDQLFHGMSVVWITHKIEDALENSDRVTVLRQGRILYTDITSNLDRVSLLRLCYADLGAQEGEDIKREQFYELMNLMEAVLRDMPAAVVVVDLAGRVRFVNNSGKRMFPGAATGGDPMLPELLGDENLHLIKLFGEAPGRTEDSVWLSQPATLLEGSNRLVDVRIRNIQERDMRIGSMVIVEDVTEREGLRQNLAFSENLASVGLLAAGVAHEVNDPLAIISNYLGFIRHGAKDEQLVSAANLAQEETIRIHQIVDNLVAFSGNVEPASATVDLGGLIRDLCRLLGFHNQGRVVRFFVDLPATPLHIHADPNEMRQVFLNLFKNSLDAIHKNGEIRVSAVPEVQDGKDFVRVTLSDTGPGIQLDNPSDIFKPFVTTKKGKGKHQGLGLSIVYGIVEKYKGHIQVRNLSENGCEFSLTFPRAE